MTITISAEELRDTAGWMVCADKARNAFLRFRDKDCSFTDCTSLVVMQELRLRQVLTTDHHFRQMEFQVLPRGV